MKKLIVCMFIITVLLGIMSLHVYAKQEFFYDENRDVVYYQSDPITKATTGTRYRVIGYTAKYRTYAARIKTVPFEDTNVGNGKVTTYFEIPAHNNKSYASVMYKSVCTRLSEVNPGHNIEFVSLWGKDNTLWFDGCMTIIEGNNQLAEMSDDGTFHKPNGSTAQINKDYFLDNTIKDARDWKVKPDLDNFFGIPCTIAGKPVPDTELAKPKANISKGSTIINDTTVNYLDNDEILLSGEKSKFPEEYADGKFYEWKYKPTSSSTWNLVVSGDGKVSPTFPKLPKGTYDVSLKVWYRIGNIIYTNISDTAQVTLNISESPQGAYVVVEPTADGDKKLTQSQIDTNATININITAKGILKKYTDISKITQWKINLRKEPAGTGDQLQTFTYTTGLGLSQTSTKIFTVQAGVLKTQDSYTQKFAVSASAVVNGKTIYSTTEYCAVTLYKNASPVQPPVSGNIPPVAVISAPSTVKVGDDVVITGSGSYDPDGTIEDYKWYLEGTSDKIDGDFGIVSYPKVGEYVIALCVVDNEGAGGVAQQTITVVPPTPVAHFSVSGKLKEKRIVYLNNTSSSPTKFPIVPNKTTWTITPVAGSGATTSIKKIVNVSTIKENVTADSYTSGSLNGVTLPVIGFDQAGDYDITLTVTNTAGLSSTSTQRITIKPDLPPVVSFKSDTKIYRETIISNTNYAKITVNDSSYSPDGDFLSYRKIYAIYDANNNGIFGDAGDQNIVIAETSDPAVINSVKTYEYLTKEVGKYEVHVIVKESYIP